MTKLLSCPSCKSTDLRYDYASCGCAVVCTDCGVHGPNKSGKSMQQKAAEAWNALPRVSDELATIIGELTVSITKAKEIATLTRDIRDQALAGDDKWVVMTPEGMERLAVDIERLCDATIVSRLKSAAKPLIKVCVATDEDGVTNVYAEGHEPDARCIEHYIVVQRS